MVHSPSHSSSADRRGRSGAIFPSALTSPSSSLLQALLDGASWDIFAVMEPNGCIRYMSPSNERLLGYALKDMVGRNGFDLIHPSDRSSLDEALARLRREPGTPVTFTHRFRTAEGEWRVLESTIQNRLDHPTLRGWVVHARDVTDRDALRGELDRMHQTLRRLQLHPHFVLNVLHTIQTELLSDPEAAAETIADFGDLLRLSYAHIDAPMVPLGHEIDFVARYVDLYHHRFGGSIRGTFDVPDEVRPILVPSLLLQPVVENALLHGLYPAGGGHVTVRARRMGDRLNLTVQDDGIGVDGAARMGEQPAFDNGDPQNSPPGVVRHREGDREQVGLSTTRARLAQIYDAEATLRLEAAREGGTMVTITLPIDISPPDDTTRPATS